MQFYSIKCTDCSTGSCAFYYFVSISPNLMGSGPFWVQSSGWSQNLNLNKDAVHMRILIKCPELTFYLNKQTQIPPQRLVQTSAYSKNHALPYTSPIALIIAHTAKSLKCFAAAVRCGDAVSVTHSFPPSLLWYADSASWGFTGGRGFKVALKTAAGRTEELVWVRLTFADWEEAEGSREARGVKTAFDIDPDGKKGKKSLLADDFCLDVMLSSGFWKKRHFRATCLSLSLSVLSAVVELSWDRRLGNGLKFVRLLIFFLFQ